MSELFREGLRRLEQEDERGIQGINAELIAALRAVQGNARRAGLDKMTEQEIEEEVAASRRERSSKSVRLARK